jgi:hypothetical protein
MKAQNNNCQKLTWKPLSSKQSGGKIAGKKEGFHLPNSVTEDVGGFSLMPHYSVKQLRRIGKQQARSKSMGISRIAKNQWRMTSKW